jgi:hypothetical protein
MGRHDLPRPLPPFGLYANMAAGVDEVRGGRQDNPTHDSGLAVDNKPARITSELQG